MTLRACITVAHEHRIQDPFRVAHQAKKWTRARWDDAYLRYRTAQTRRWQPVSMGDEVGAF